MLSTDNNVDMVTIQTPEDVTLLLDALSVISWSNTFGTPVLEDAATKVVSPAALRKSSYFRSSSLAEFNALLSKLAMVGIISEMMTQLTGGRPRDIFLLNQAFTPENAWKLTETKINEAVVYRLTHFFSTSPLRKHFAEHHPVDTVAETTAIEETTETKEQVSKDLPPSIKLKATNDFTFTSKDGYFQCFKKEQVISDPAIVKEVLELGLPVALAKEETVPPPVTLRAIHNFMCTNKNGFLLSFKQGQVITDPLTIRELLELGMPVINSEEVIPASHFYCDRCFRLHKKLDAPEPGAKYALRPRVHFFAMFQGRLLEFDPSKIIADPIVVRYFNELSDYYPTKVVYRGVDYVDCPCGNLFYFNKDVRQEE